MSQSGPESVEDQVARLKKEMVEQATGLEISVTVVALVVAAVGVGALLVWMSRNCGMGYGSSSVWTVGHGGPKGWGYGRLG